MPRRRTPSSRSASRSSRGAELIPTGDIVGNLEKLALRRETPAGEGRLVWRIWGDGAPVVLLHGGHGSWTHWIRNIPALASRHRVIVPDLPGFGDSSAIPGTAIPPVAEAVARGLERIGVGEGFMAGFSYGASVASYVLPLRKGLTRRLFLIGAAGLGPFDPVSGMRQWRSAASDGERLAAHRYNLERLMISRPDRIDALALELQARNAERARTDPNKASLAADVVGMLRIATPPLTGIWGEHDALAARHIDQRRRLIASLHDDAGFTVVADAGHWVQYEKPDVVNRIMLDSMRRDLARDAPAAALTASAGRD